MKGLIFICTIIVLFFSKAYSQDTIFTKTGKTIICEITDEDSLSIYFVTIINTQYINTSIKRESIERVSYNKLLESQSFTGDSILAVKKNNAYEYYYQRKKLTYSQLEKILFNKINAREYSDDSKMQHTIAMFFGCSGGGLIGYPLGTAISGETPSLGMAAIGVVCFLISLPLEYGSQISLRKAVDTYNNEIAKEKANMKGDAAVQKQ